MHFGLGPHERLGGLVVAGNVGIDVSLQRVNRGVVVAVPTQYGCDCDVGAIYGRCEKRASAISESQIQPFAGEISADVRANIRSGHGVQIVVSIERQNVFAAETAPR